ncbi:DUF2283 domain-containing protein [Streptosporangium sp. CA-115845]|uniref:DUF2283 domain-containing protein n=1 Tax=Streptosporangium sp. CA-115845 TaxID=3240071 RepID=UPI003D8CF97F
MSNQIDYDAVREAMGRAGRAMSAAVAASGLSKKAPASRSKRPARAFYTYDAEAGATYVALHGLVLPGDVTRTVEVPATVNLDLDEGGQVIGIEILAAWPEASAVPKGEKP